MSDTSSPPSNNSQLTNYREAAMPQDDSYFSKVNTLPGVKDALSSSIVAELASTPEEDGMHPSLPTFDDTEYSTWYAQPCAQDGSSDRPTHLTERSTSSPDIYLLPTMTRHERIRLTTVWYYTRNIKIDAELLGKLQEKTDFMADFLGWEITVVSVMGAAFAIRVAASGVTSLGDVPRRGSMCAETITQDPGSVFMADDLANDDRFNNTDWVSKSGVRSYAGTQLHCKTETEEDVALGTLSVLSKTSGRILSPRGQAILVLFADILTEDIVNRSRRVRFQQRHLMGEIVLEIQRQGARKDIEKFATSEIGRIYPMAHVTVQISEESTIRLRRRALVRYSEMRDGLWEDSALLDRELTNKNYTRLQPPVTIRAIVGRCGTLPRPKFFVVDSTDVQLVFDDNDAWFIEKCSLVLCDILQKRAVEEALKIKEGFLRGITHQLRTPIHGVLGSTELLSEELKTLIGGQWEDEERTEIVQNARALLQTIHNSGKELMSTVNNILRLNRLIDMENVTQQKSFCDLEQLEYDLHDEVFRILPAEERSQVTMLFDNQVAADMPGFLIDSGLLKECMAALIMNATKFTTHGSVTVIMSAALDYSFLRFDVVDTGCGIKEEDHDRIFQAYEKVDMFGNGNGLGLTLAAKIANVLGGSITLIASKEGMGSHFRADFYDPIFASPMKTPRHRSHAKLENAPKLFFAFQEFHKTASPLHHFSKCLERRGMKRTEEREGSLQLIDYAKGDDIDKLVGFIKSSPEDQAIACLVPTKTALTPLRDILDHPRVVIHHGPYYSRGLEDVVMEIDKVYQQISAKTGRNNSGVNLPSEDPVRPVVARIMPNALAVDDNEINLRIMRMNCEKKSIPCVTAVNGIEAVELFKKASATPINLVLLDLQMPLCDGAQACAEMRAFEEETDRKPSVIFMITGQDSVADRQRSLASGANEFYVKPLGLKALNNAIDSYFARPR